MTSTPPTRPAADATTLVIARRYNGPPDSANGGYACGALAVATGEGLRVRLLAPPPLERPLTVQAGDSTGSYSLCDGDRPVATAVPASLDLEVPAAPPYVQAVWASQHYAGFREHTFPDCFVCGPHRRRGDGLRIFPGMLDSGIVAAPWLPADDLDRGDGKVAVEFHWAALDCPGYFALVGERPRKMLLGEMQAHVDRRVHVGESCTVIGWAIGVDGRKHYSGTAIFDEDGELCARARATWIEVSSV
jgi:hypothetical protein